MIYSSSICLKKVVWYNNNNKKLFFSPLYSFNCRCRRLNVDDDDDDKKVSKKNSKKYNKKKPSSIIIIIWIWIECQALDLESENSFMNRKATVQWTQIQQQQQQWLLLQFFFFIISSLKRWTFFYFYFPEFAVRVFFLCFSSSIDVPSVSVCVCVYVWDDYRFRILQNFFVFISFDSILFINFIIPEWFEMKKKNFGPSSLWLVLVGKKKK